MTKLPQKDGSKITFANESVHYQIKPGMMANIKIPLEKRLAFLVKEGSILSQDDISYVYVIVNKNEICIADFDVTPAATSKLNRGPQAGKVDSSA